MPNGLFKSRLSNFNYRSLVTGERLWQISMAVASGLLLLISFPSFSWEYAAWVALAPLRLRDPGVSLLSGPLLQRLERDICRGAAPVQGVPGGR